MYSHPVVRSPGIVNLYSLYGKNLVNISAGKYWTAAVTKTGDVFMWDGKEYKNDTPIPTRVHGVKRATSVSVGETHLLIVCAIYHPAYARDIVEVPKKISLDNVDELEELDEDFMFDDAERDNKQTSTGQKDESNSKIVPSLKSLCEKVAAEFLVEPRNALQLLEIADSLQADSLQAYCEEIAIRNLDYIFTVSTPAVANASLEILVRLEKSLDLWSSEPWSHCRLPSPTAAFPAVIDSEEEDSETGCLHLRANNNKPLLHCYKDDKMDGFFQPQSGVDQAIFKQVRALRKKLQQIEMLEAKQSDGHLLDDQQMAKLQTKSALESALVELGAPLETPDRAPSSVPPDGKGGKKSEISRQQRRKNKKRVLQQQEAHSVKPATCSEPNTVKGFPDVKTTQFAKEKGYIVGKETSNSTVIEEHSYQNSKDTVDCPLGNKSSRPTSSKKKNKKGGLSMFLSGALDDTPIEVTPPPTPKSEGPAWGGAKISKGSSLRDIQDEQSKIKESQSDRRMKERFDDFADDGNSGQIRLSLFLPVAQSSPIAVVPARGSPVPDGEKGTPPWSASGTSPNLCKPSLRDIQMLQEKKQVLSHSPKTRTAGFSVSSSSVGSPSESNSSTNRWFKPEMDAPSSIRSIQIEERAMKDLKRFYSNVKVVRKAFSVAMDPS
ncbi:hypothetical protein ACLOJK_040818 [Asimina triloba]